MSHQLIHSSNFEAKECFGRLHSSRLYQQSTTIRTANSWFVVAMAHRTSAPGALVKF
jgi:hypothetical protein